MKHILKIHLSAVIAAGLLLFTACEKDAIDDLTGKYPAPESYTLQLSSQRVQKQDATRVFTLVLASADASLSVELVGSRTSQLLEAGSYTAAAQGAAKSGNYVAGYGTGGTIWKKGAASLNVIDGTIAVKRDGDAYTISGTVMLEDNTIIKVAYSGAIVFEPDPPAFTYTLEVQKPYAWTADGATYTEVAGSQLNKITVSSDGMPVAYFEIVTAADIASYAGAYPVSSEIRDANGAAVQGVYMDLSQYVPGLIIEGGSYLLDGEDKQYLSAGSIAIADNGGVLTFTSSDLAILDKATGQPKDGTQSINYAEATRVILLPNLLSASATNLAAVSGGALTGYTVTLKLGEAGLTATPNEYGGLDISGTGKYISIDFSRDEATLPAGNYNIVDNTTAAVGDAIAGYVLDLGFMTMNAGSMWISVDNNVPAETFITGGTVTVAESGGTYTITVNATTADGAVSAVYTGAITIP
jgi:hypothetical protein